MFETLFSYGATKRHHQQGPLSAQRDAYLHHRRPLATRRRGHQHHQLSKQAVFNLGPLRRYYGETAEIDLAVNLDRHSCVIPGSYAIHLHAVVRTGAREKKNFSLADLPPISLPIN